MATRKLEVIITGDAKSLEKALGKAGNQGRSFAKTMGKAGVAGALVGLGAAVKIGVGEFMEAEKITAQTNAVLKSTGGIANVTTKEVQGLSEALMKKSGVDDEAIQSGQNMLLTFTKIRNETGKGNDVFNQATQATLNLSVAMGKDMQSSALLLGKALNDPIKGMASLGRAGVQFTEDQKDTIKGLIEGASAARALSTTLDKHLTPAQYKQALAMEKSGLGIDAIAKKMNLDFTPAQMRAAQELMKGGETMKAQKIILKELETQFGGSAEAAGKTFAGQISIAKERLTNFAGEMVGKSIPALQAMFTFLNVNLVPILKELGATFKRVWEGVAQVLEENKATINQALTALKTNLQGVSAAALFLEEKVITPILMPLFSKLLPLAIQPTVASLSTLALGIEKIRVLFVWLREKGAAAVKAFEAGSAGPLKDLFTAFDKIRGAVDKVVDGITWLIDHIPRIPKVPDIGVPGWLDPRNIGTERGPRVTIPAGVTAGLGSITSIGAQHGLMVTSGFRPGDPGDHGKGKAIDISNTYRGDPDGTPQMDAAFLALASVAGQLGLKDLLYTPGLWKYGFNIDNGRRAAFSVAGHGDHIHASVFDQGGWLKPGLTLAYNGTGRPEPVGGPGWGSGDIVIKVGELEIARAVMNGNARLRGQGVTV